MDVPRISPRVFRAIQTLDVETLEGFSDVELRPVLTSLVRMSLIASLDKSAKCQDERSSVLRILSRIELVNSLVSLLSIDFQALEHDVRKEISLRSKLGSSTIDSVLVPSLNLAPALEFERSDAMRRLRLVLAELVAVMGQVSAIPKDDDVATNNFVIKVSELFDHLVYLPEVCDVLATAMAELPNLLPPAEVAEALLRFKYGPEVICHIVANQPDSFRDVVGHILKNGDKQDDVNCNAVRQRALLLLCKMNPSQILPVQTSCIESCRLPSLVILLALEDKSTDLVSFMSSLLLGTDHQVRSWISYFMRNAKKKHQEGALADFRAHLLTHLRSIVTSAREYESRHVSLSQKLVIRGSALLRLYTALRGIAGLKLSEEESTSILDLITCQAPATSAGVKFVSLGLCMIIACNSLISTPESEKRVVAWIHWLVDQAEHYEQITGLSASFGEMLLLIAIHFHSNQLSAVGDLVCQTLGMKISIRSNAMSKKISHIFTQEIFNEQTVAAHAVHVPVTPNLSSNISGFLPVHCIHQLLKSRAFSKHKVPIKDWIYRQVCESAVPVHPVMPTVIEAFVNSILVPASGRVGTSDTPHTNEPISEDEIRAFFTGTSFETLPERFMLPKGSRPTSPVSKPHTDDESNLAAQILLLYYVLLYENVRLSHMKSIICSNRRVLKYSQELFASLPIKFLLQTAEKEQENFGCLFPQLLRLCSTHFPHLCLVQDWLRQEEDVPISRQMSLFPSRAVEMFEMEDALARLKTSPSKLTMLMQQMSIAPAKQKWEVCQLLINDVKKFLDDDTPLQIQDLFRDLWFSMNDYYPRKLWAATVHYMCANKNGQTVLPNKITQDDPILDPLMVLRCDRRIFQVAPMLEVVLYILKACLAASRVHLQQHIQENPILERSQNLQLSSDLEREELKNALIATQESAAIQILLEGVLANDKSSINRTSMSNVKEIKLLCSYIHEAFINDPNLAKLVHFQGYPLEFLPVTTTGVPSMHICLDFVPELLRQPEIEKQVFAVDLVSHLSIQYSLPKSYSTARLAVNSLSTLLSVMSHNERRELMPPVLPSLVRFCKAFPPLIEDIVSLLIQYGRIAASESCLESFPVSKLAGFESLTHRDFRDRSDQDLAAKITETFSEILENGVLEQRLF